MLRIRTILFVLNSEAKSFVIKKIREEWSPEQICGFAKRHSIFSLSHELIYQFMLTDKKQGGNLYKHLRHQHKKYRKRYGSPKRLGPIKNRRFIDDRPSIVNTKSRVGDWEIDAIIGQNHKQAVISIVERVSKLTILKKVPSKKSGIVSKAIIEALKPLSDTVTSITADNGSEFAGHEEISKQLNTDFFFAHPYSSWERGLNENTNGLVRQYLKKGSSFTGVSDHSLSVIMDKLNNRPRKTLGYATPNEFFNQIVKMEK